MTKISNLRLDDNEEPAEDVVHALHITDVRVEEGIRAQQVAKYQQVVT